MYLSKLQKYILLECYLSKKRRYLKKELLKFYDKKKKTKEEDRQGSITRSVERLIGKGLLVGYGEKTAQKLYLNQIRLTSLGRKVSRKLLDKQQKLPLKKLTKKT